MLARVQASVPAHIEEDKRSLPELSPDAPTVVGISEKAGDKLDANANVLLNYKVRIRPGEPYYQYAGLSTWRSWWDGGSAFGPIATKWNVTDWPALYVLDHKGVIRHKWVGRSPGDEMMDQAVDALVKDAERASVKH